MTAKRPNPAGSDRLVVPFDADDASDFPTVADVAQLVDTERMLRELTMRAEAAGELMFSDTLRAAHKRASFATEAALARRYP